MKAGRKGANSLSEANVDALMSLCERREASLCAAATRRRLLEALLAEALAPADDRELEAAE
jgi:type I restriction enzyme S subunit